MKKTLTVSIAAYNAEDYLMDALDSLVRSELIEQIEVIIVDDGSKDTTLDIAMEYQKQYPTSIKIIEKENGGWGSTINQSIKQAEGKYFKQLDADDLFWTSDLTKLVKDLEKEKADIIITSYETFDHDTKKRMSFHNNMNMQMYKYNYLYQINELPKENNIDMHSITVKTSILKENNVQLLEKCFYTDVEFVIKSISNAETFIIYDYLIYRYRLNRDGQSMSLQGIRNHINDHIKALNENMEYVECQKNNKAYIQLHLRIQSMVCMQYYFFLCLEGSKEDEKKVREFDLNLKKKYPQYYMNVGKRIKLLRFSHFCLYPIMCRATSYDIK